MCQALKKWFYIEGVKARIKRGRPAMPYKDDDSQNKNIYEVKGKLFVLSLSINSVSLIA